MLRQGTSEAVDVPQQAYVVLVDAEGRFLGTERPERHGGVVAQWSDFMLQYTQARQSV